jgi:hypothetical protein
MSLENQNFDSVDELRRIVLGENIASISELEALEKLAYSSLDGAPVSRILEVNYCVAPGYLGFMLVEEDDLNPETAPAVVLSMHAGDTDDPYFLLSYDSQNTLRETVLSGERSQTENIFHAMNILQEVLHDRITAPLSGAEVAVVNRLASFLKVAEGIDDDTVATTGPTTEPTVHFTDVVRQIVRQKCSAIQHTREASGNIGDGQEITIVAADYEQVEGSEPLELEERYPLLQINLMDRASGLLTYYLSLATGERICDTTPLSDDNSPGANEFYISDDEDHVQFEADDIIAVSMSGLNGDSINRLANAIRQLGLHNLY